MKKTIILIAFLTSCFAINAQNCKYKVNEIDKFTGKFTKITKPKTVIATWFTAGEFSVKKEDTNYYFIFNYGLSKYSNFEAYSINPGAKLMFMLEDNSIVTLETKYLIKGSMSVVYGIPPVYVCALNNVVYQISLSDCQKFFNSKVKTIRFYRSESNGKEDYIDNEIKERNKDDIQQLIRCIM